VYDFLLTFHSNHGPISYTVSEIDGDFSRKSQNFPTPLYFAPPLKWFLLELNIDARGQKTRLMGLPGRERSLTISSASGYNPPTWRTDTGRRQQRPRLRIELKTHKINHRLALTKYFKAADFGLGVRGFPVLFRHGQTDALTDSKRRITSAPCVGRR